jgi:hypothetical protein
METRNSKGWFTREPDPLKMVRFKALWMELESFIDERDHVAAKAVLYAGLREFLPSLDEVAEHDAADLERRYLTKPSNRPPVIDIEARAAEVRRGWSDLDHARRAVGDVTPATRMPKVKGVERRGANRSDAS